MGVRDLGGGQATEPAGKDVASRFYDAGGTTLDYVHELDGDVLRIWAGAKGSPAYYEGSFTEGGDAVAGDWVYPGGGYRSTMARATP